jgi:DNA-binding NarL/FixJ family response regulator
MAKSKGKLFLFQWDDESAEERASELTAAGWEVAMETEEGERGYKNCKAFAPDIVLFGLAKKPSHSREVARALRQSKPFRETPFLFVDGTEEDIAKAKQKASAAQFTTSKSLINSLTKLAPKPRQTVPN